MWFTVVLIVQILVILSMIAAVLLQRSEGGALGMGGGGGGGGGGGLMTSRGAGSALTRATAILAAMFFVCSIILTILARNMIDDGLDYTQGEAPAAIGGVAVPTLEIPAVPTGAGDEEKPAEDDSPLIPE